MDVQRCEIDNDHCFLEAVFYENGHPDLTIEYVERSPDPWYGDTDTSVDITPEKVREIITFLEQYCDHLNPVKTDELQPIAFRVPDIYSVGEDSVIIESCNKNGTSWAIRCSPRCMNREGEWEHEPFPSNRDELFLERCRFPTANDAFKFIQSVNNKQKNL